MRSALRLIVCVLAAAALNARAADVSPEGGAKATPEAAAKEATTKKATTVPSDGSMASDEEIGGGSGEPTHAVKKAKKTTTPPSDGSMTCDEEIGGGSGEPAHDVKVVPPVPEDIWSDRG